MRLSFLGLLLASSLSFPALADSEAPSTVNNVSATAISDSSIRVTWNRPFDNVGVQGYNVYRDGLYYATVFNTNFIDNGLSANQTFRYGIVAFDAAKNFNRASDAVSATTNGGGSNNNAAPPPPAETDGGVSVPAGLNSEIVDGNTAILRWNASSGDLRNYNVFRDNAYVATVSGTEFRAEYLNWGQDYRFQVSAVSRAREFSNKSVAITVNTSNSSSSQQATEQSNNDQPRNDGNNNNRSSGSVPDGYRLVFSEEFNDYSLDPSKWNTRYRWGPNWIINGEKQYYVDTLNDPNFGHSPFEFDGNHMTISAIRTPEHLRSKANWQQYLSGAMTTYNKFQMRYGYLEMRAQLPKGRGLWSAFWLLHQHDNDRRPEIDIVEYIGSNRNEVYNTYHYYDNFSLRSSPTYEVQGPDYSQDFHTYAVKWEPGKLTWYVDGVERNVHRDGNVAWEDMYILVNLAVGGWWPGDPDGSTEFPARMRIDYIRAYQQ